MSAIGLLLESASVVSGLVFGQKRAHVLILGLNPAQISLEGVKVVDELAREISAPRLLNQRRHPVVKTTLKEGEW